MWAEINSGQNGGRMPQQTTLLTDRSQRKRKRILPTKATGRDAQAAARSAHALRDGGAAWGGRENAPCAATIVRVKCRGGRGVSAGRALSCLAAELLVAEKDVRIDWERDGCGCGSGFWGGRSPPGGPGSASPRGGRGTWANASRSTGGDAGSPEDAGSSLTGESHSPSCPPCGTDNVSLSVTARHTRYGRRFTVFGACRSVTSASLPFMSISGSPSVPKSLYDCMSQEDVTIPAGSRKECHTAGRLSRIFFSHSEADSSAARREGARA